MKEEEYDNNIFYGNAAIAKENPFWNTLDTPITLKNFKMDGRVSKKYGGKFAASVNTTLITAQNDLKRLLQENEVLRPFSPINQYNTDICQAPTRLLRIDSIKAFARSVITQATNGNVSSFTGLLKDNHDISNLQGTPKQLNKLATQLYNSLKDQENVTATKQLYQALAQSNDQYPWWCTAAEDIDKLGKEEWTNALGLGHLRDYNHHKNTNRKIDVFVLKYESNKDTTGPLYRPTVLQTLNKYHIPSSPYHCSGYSLHLKPQRSDHTPLREYIHRPITRFSNVTIDVTRLTTPEYNDLIDCRQKHLKHLPTCDKTKQWQAKCTNHKWV